MAANSRFAVATHVMTALYLNQGQRLSSQYLASSVNTNPVVIRKIIADLCRARLVESHTGNAGGSQITSEGLKSNLSQIYVAVKEGNLFAYNRSRPNQKCKLSCSMKGLLEPIFDKAELALSKELYRVSLKQVAEQFSAGPVS